MNEKAHKVIVETVNDAIKVATANALTYMMKGIESCQNFKIEETSFMSDMKSLRSPTVEEALQYLRIYLEKAIEQIEEDMKKE